MLKARGIIEDIAFGKLDVTCNRAAGIRKLPDD